MTKCKQRAREVMYWPSMNADIEKCVSECIECASLQNQQSAEHLNPTKQHRLKALIGHQHNSSCEGGQEIYYQPQLGY